LYEFYREVAFLLITSLNFHGDYSYRLFLPVRRHIVSNGGVNQIFQSRLINIVTFAEIDGAGSLRLKAGVEETLWILQGSTFEKNKFQMILKKHPHCKQDRFETILRCPISIPRQCQVQLRGLICAGRQFAAPVF